MKKELWLLKKNHGYSKRGNQFLIGTVYWVMGNRIVHYPLHITHYFTGFYPF